MVDPVTGKACYKPLDTFPIEGDTVPNGYNGWLVLLDELSSAPRAIQAAAYKLILDRMVGNHHLHEKVWIVAAGNLITDGAIVEEMSTALQSRMAHFELVINNDEWLNWAYANDTDYRITSFLKFKGELLYNFKPDHTDHTYACPRTWEFASRLIKDKDLSDTSLYLPLLAGTVGEGVAREFLVFVSIYKDLPSKEDIEKNPDLIAIPKDPSVLWALTGTIGSYINHQNADALVKFTNRLPMEFQVVTMREISIRNRAVFTAKPLQEWMSKNSKLMA